MIRTWISLVPADHRAQVTHYAVLAFVAVVVRAVGAVLLVPLVGALFSDTPQRALAWLGWLSVATVTGWIVDATTARIGFNLGFAVLDHSQHDVADRLPGVRLDWFTADNTATARQAIAATGPELVGLVVNLLTPLSTAVLLPAVIAVALLGISWQLGVAALAGVPLLLGALWASLRLTRRADAAAGDANTALTERIIEFARTQQALRAARRVEPARSLVGTALAEQHSATMRLLGMQIPGQLLFSVASQLALIALAGATTALTMNGTLTVAEAVALIVVIARYLEPFTTVSELAPALESTRATLDRIRGVLTAPALVAGAAGLSDAAVAPRIEFDDVAFGYDGASTPVLDGVSFALQPGTTTAIVGPSGSGKSTILALIAGLHQPTRGRVVVDGADAATLDAQARRAVSSVVFQHPYLFHGTIRDNVFAGNPTAGDDQFGRAVALARVDELIGRLPDGADTVVGEAGSALSGGERQRVSIARALLKAAPVLLVDEATSALDTENEVAVVDALTADPQARTRVIVAHRLASIRHADRVLFVDNGRVVEDGSIDELLAAGGRFSEFWRQQHDAADWHIVAE
ncbi:ABC transporter ATP-binding protein [Mycobacterium montefiorense]|uniref:Mycobactin import ATP-binding/permease protein IrtB n=1 Tax=Mycobacterium montefiorense TaxID=154654 RepID=A0AA37PPZ9_9MYCO|nr:ABC transporter ATP-binding protein [Mycobacterium montefiorense]GBG39741.1 iron import ATP-binding/permease protein IrtB [Mycobacterium montefiorense]GKU35612.1 iron import ATP-binding/permease protein IrtB [Mycobacterium montefiorense]GKU40617.1 iron import ATP-binding/permease protein IrtB [Mycobacterium montefiorense]GKU45120.1 iron import ATP-binding/permease protein IrtB [Mycobacterium montefiorense]GKU51270.1 iron import ATP-binding/permease protein IrtB [Mycobacterium montefiorense]